MSNDNECQLCLEKYDHSIHRPYTLSCMTHTFCISCLNRLNNNKCPTCKIVIKGKSPNLALLNLTPLSNYDKLKSEIFKTLNEVQDYQDIYLKRRELTLNEHKIKLDSIIKATNDMVQEKMNQLIVNQVELNDKIKSIEFNLNNRFESNDISSEAIIESKKKLERNELSEDMIKNLKIEIEQKIKKLNELNKEVENFNENYFFIPNNSDCSVGEIKTGEMVNFEFYSLNKQKLCILFCLSYQIILFKME